MRQEWGRGSCVAEGFGLADPRRGILVHEINKIMALQRSDFQIVFELILSKIVVYKL